MEEKKNKMLVLKFKMLKFLKYKQRQNRNFSIVYCDTFVVTYVKSYSFTV